MKYSIKLHGRTLTLELKSAPKDPIKGSMYLYKKLNKYLKKHNLYFDNLTSTDKSLSCRIVYFSEAEFIKTVDAKQQYLKKQLGME